MLELINFEISEILISTAAVEYFSKPQKNKTM
jgi:hypothetical protein